MSERASHCPCAIDESHGYDDCPRGIHVMCDAACGALDDPNASAAQRDLSYEWERAATHWRKHALLGGCSHAA